jgi:hypothetical protein
MSSRVKRFQDLETYLAHLGDVLQRADKSIEKHDNKMKKREPIIRVIKIIAVLVVIALFVFAGASYLGVIEPVYFVTTVFVFLAIVAVLFLSIAILTSHGSLNDMSIITNTQHQVSEMHMAFVGWMLGERKMYGLGITLDSDLQPESINLLTRPDELASEEVYGQTFPLKEFKETALSDYWMEIVLCNGIHYEFTKDTRLGTHTKESYEKLQDFIYSIHKLSEIQSGSMLEHAL